jgi:hypothetical protein
MARVMIELDEAQEQRLQEIAAAEQRSEEDLCREAVEQFLKSHIHLDAEPSADPYEPLMKMIGLVEEGPTDASVHHDLRPGEEE